MNDGGAIRIPPSEESWVEVLPSDPIWALWYAEESAPIAAAFAPRAAGIEHFGSTAVAGLAAKPIVDVLVGVTDKGAPIRAELERMETCGYTFLGQDGRRPERWFWRKRGARSFNVSLVPYGGLLWEQNLLLRDYLRGNPEAARRYAQVKRRASELSPQSLRGYQDHKRAFVESLHQQARSWQRRVLA